MQHDYTVTVGRRTKQKESPIFAFLIVGGLVGITYLHFDIQNNKNISVQSPDYKAFIQTNAMAVAPIQQQETPQSAFMQMVSSEKLFVPNDYLEAELPAFFTLKNASTAVTYELDLGDGHKKSFKDGKVTHTYQNNKTVTVKLFGTFEGETKMIQEREYNVARPAEVEIAAEVVDYSTNQ
jgi:hypothetical protein